MGSVDERAAPTPYQRLYYSQRRPPAGVQARPTCVRARAGHSVEFGPMKATASTLLTRG
jgi:hypothetical protein